MGLVTIETSIGDHLWILILSSDVLLKFCCKENVDCRRISPERRMILFNHRLSPETHPVDLIIMDGLARNRRFYLPEGSSNRPENLVKVLAFYHQSECFLCWQAIQAGTIGFVSKLQLIKDIFPRHSDDPLRLLFEAQLNFIKRKYIIFIAILFSFYFSVVTVLSNLVSDPYCII